MKLTELIDTLTMGYLSNHVMGNISETTGLPIHLAKFIPMVNAGLMDLHKKFVIRKEEVRIMCSASINRYELTPDFVYLDGYPMTSEIVRIMEVYDKTGALCTMDNISNVSAKYAEHTKELINGYGINIMLPAFNVIGTPKGYEGILKILYQAGATKIPTVKEGLNVAASVVTVDLPNNYLDALCMYVCSRIFTTILPDQGLAAANTIASTYLRMYDEECQRIMLLGLSNEGVAGEYDNFEKGGWV